MKLEVFAIYDAATGAYGHPFYSVSIGDAVRTFASAAQDPSTKINKFAKDFSLFHVATYDDQNASFDNLHAPRHISSAHEFIGIQSVSVQSEAQV